MHTRIRPLFSCAALTPYTGSVKEPDGSYCGRKIHRGGRGAVATVLTGLLLVAVGTNIATLFAANAEPPTPPTLVSPEPPAAPPAAPSTTAGVPSKPSQPAETWFLCSSGGFRLRFPRGWIFGPGPSPCDCTGWSPTDLYQARPFTQLSVVGMNRTALAAPAEDDATDMVRLTQESLKARLSNFHWVDSGDLKFPPLPATIVPQGPTPNEEIPASAPVHPQVGKYLVYTCTSDGQDIAGVIFFLVDAKRQYIVHGRCLANRLEDSQATFKTIVQSIEITGPPVSPWTEKDGRWTSSEAGCALTLPAEYKPTTAGSISFFRAASDDKTKSGPQVSLTTEPLPAPLAWVVYLEGVKRGLRERLVDFKPLSDTAITLDSPVPGVEAHLFEYAQTVGKETVRVCGLYCLADHKLVVLTGSAPEGDYAAARDAIFLPAARSLQWLTPTTP